MMRIRINDKIDNSNSNGSNTLIYYRIVTACLPPTTYTARILPATYYPLRLPLLLLIPLILLLQL